MADAADLLDKRHGRINDDARAALPRNPYELYTQEQAQAYATGRGTTYPTLLYASITSFHNKRDGEFKRLLDIGCGPGRATRDLAADFCEVIGIDVSPEMIIEAKRDEDNEDRKRTKKGLDIVFAVCSAEKLDEAPGVEEGSIDMITVAMSAHWFNMTQFWTKAAKVVKPGGTVAIWTCSSLYAHPDTPNYKAVQAALDRLEKQALAPHETPFNKLSREHYDHLPLPWDLDPPVTAFPKELYKREEWDRDGVLSSKTKKDFFGNKGELTSLEDLEKSLDTVSMVTRWRNAHPEAVGTEKDVVKQTMRELKTALGGQSGFVTGTATTLLLFTKANV